MNILDQLLVVICKKGEVNVCCQHKLKGKSILRPGQVDKFQNENLGAYEKFQVIRDTDQYDYLLVSIRLLRFDRGREVKMSLVRDQALGWGISTSLIFSDLNFAQVCYWDIARIEVIVNNLFGRWNGEFIELGFDHQTILHCDHNCDHKLSKGNLECFYFLFLRDHSSITSEKGWVGGVANC